MTNRWVCCKVMKISSLLPRNILNLHSRWKNYIAAKVRTCDLTKNICSPWGLLLVFTLCDAKFWNDWGNFLPRWQEYPHFSPDCWQGLGVFSYLDLLVEMFDFENPKHPTPPHLSNPEIGTSHGETVSGPRCYKVWLFRSIYFCYHLDKQKSEKEIKSSPQKMKLRHEVQRHRMHVFEIKLKLRRYKITLKYTK